MTSRPGFEVPLESIPTCFEGTIPAPIGTVDADGMPNVTYLSVVSLIDETHVALSRQFFQKTDANTLINPYAQVVLIEPTTGRQFALDLVYERTVTEGPLFERMRTKLDAVAAHEGMANIFVLKGTDLCRVEACRMLPCDFPQPEPVRGVQIEKLEAATSLVAAANDLEDLLSKTLEACENLFGNGHAFVMLTDETGERLYTVDSTGYPTSGAGSEVKIGEGLIGLAAARRQAIRLTHLTRDRAYSNVAHLSARAGESGEATHVIPLPSLATMESQLIVPMLAHRQLVGVICLQSHEPGAFHAKDEAALGILANQVATAMAHLQPAEASHEVAPVASPAGRPLQIRYYRDDDSVFVDNEYLIKGVAGGILWRLLSQYNEEGRVEFSNKEIRLDQTLDLPDIKDNLEARLILLRKRLVERSEHIRIEKTGRGRFKLVVSRPLALTCADSGAPF